MANPGEKESRPGPSQGIEIDISFADRTLQPKFEPVIKKIGDLVREVTGTACSESVAAKLRW